MRKRAEDDRGGHRSRIRTGLSGGIMASLALLLLLGGAPSGAGAQERIDERHPLRSDGRLEVGVVTHSIRVEAWDREEVHLTGTYDPEVQRLEVSGDDGSLSVRIHHHRRGGRSGSGSLELRVPRGARLSASSVSGGVEAEGVSGEVRMNSTSGRLRLVGAPSTASLNTVSGGIEVQGAIPELRLNSVSGSITARDVRGRVNASTVSGELRVNGSGPLDQLRANTVSGRVDIAGELTPEASVDVESHSGSVTLRVPGDAPAEYEIHTMSGSIRNRITGDETRSPRMVPSRSLFFTVGAGTARVRVETFSGSVTLEPLR